MASWQTGLRVTTSSAGKNRKKVLQSKVSLRPRLLCLIVKMFLLERLRTDQSRVCSNFNSHVLFVLLYIRLTMKNLIGQEHSINLR